MDNSNKIQKLNLELDFNQLVQKLNLQLATIKQKVDFLLTKINLNNFDQNVLINQYLNGLTRELENFIFNEFEIKTDSNTSIYLKFFEKILTNKI